MKLFKYCKDGGPESHVFGHFLIEIKKLFSVVVLKFTDGSRDVYHTHAFNAVSWVIRGKLVEENFNGTINEYKPSFKPILTGRDTYHKVVSVGDTWAITLRGPWKDKWFEYLPNSSEQITLTNGRKVLPSQGTTK